jgi:hypothetical protein
MNSLTKVLLEDVLEAEKKKVTAIYGGGFKPPTKGHYAVVEKAAEQDPEIDDIIIYVGGGERDGITQAESIQVWELYKKYLPLKTRIEPSKAPVGDVLRYAKEHPDEEVLWIIGARENNPEDFADIASRTRTIDKYPNLQLRVIQTTGGVSGTAARKAVKDNNKEQFSHLIPDIEEKEQVWDIVSPIIKENIFKDLKGALKSIWSKGGKLTQDIIDGAKREGKETTKLVQLLNKMLYGDSITDDEKTFMKAQGKDLLKILPLVAIQGIPLPIPITPLLLLLGKKFGFNILPDSHEVMPLSSLNEYNNTGPSTPKVYIVKADGTYKEVPIGILSKIPNLTYDMGGGETNYYPEKNIVIVDNIPVEQFAKEPGEIKDEKIYVEYNLNQPFSFPKANKIFAAQVVYHLGDIKSFAKTVNDSLKNGGTFQFFSDLMNKQDKEFLNYLSSEYGFGLPKNLNPYKGGNLLLKKGEYTEPVISYIYSVTDAEGNTAKVSVTKEGRWWEYAKIEGDIDFKPIKWSVEPEYKYNNITPSKEDVLYSFSKALETDIVDFKKLNETLDEGSCGYDTDVKTGKKLDTPGGLEEGRPKKKDPKKGTGKKPEGSGRRLYTDEDPKDTVGISFKTKEDIVDTLNKASFKSKSHARQSQIINLIHQRVRAAYSKAKDPEVKARLKRGLDYIESRKEASKKKTERLRKMKEASDPQAGTALPYGSGFAPIKESYQFKLTDKDYDEEDKSLLSADYKFSTPNNDYRVEFYSGEYSPESKTFDLSFGLDAGYTNKLDTFQMTREGNALSILKTIINIIKDFTNRFDVNKLVINPTSEKRGKVYSMILKSLPTNILNKIEIIQETVTATQVICDNCGWEWAIKDGGDDLYICHKCGHDNTPNSNDPFGLNELARQFVNESLMETWNPQESFVSLSKYMINNGMNIKPLPKIKIIPNDEENASNLLGKTAYYNPTEKSITLFTMDRHPKDILRSFSHEMVHHEQNLNGKLNNINTTNTNEDGDLPEIEREAYEKGNIMLRNWEDTIKNV